MGIIILVMNTQYHVELKKKIETLDIENIMTYNALVCNSE